MLRILYIGNFRPAHSTENHVRQALESLGHSVIPLQEDRTDPIEIRNIAVDNTVHLVLYTRTWGLNGPQLLQIWRELKERGIITASYHLDIYYGITREPLYQMLRPKGITGLADDPFWRTQYVFTVDGDPQAANYFKELGINHLYLRAGLFHKEAFLAEHTGWENDIAFVGSYHYHPEWPYRQQLINRLKETYGERFKLIPEPGTPAIRNEALNKMYANTKVIIGDSLVPGFTKPQYWSDRVYETLGRGGFLIHPFIEGMQEEFKDGAHLIFYNFNDFADLESKIDYFLEHEEERESIRHLGQRLVAEYYTYMNRMQSMLTTLAEHEPLIKQRI